MQWKEVQTRPMYVQNKHLWREQWEVASREKLAARPPADNIRSRARRSALILAK
jgi:hypothetical protein